MEKYCHEVRLTVEHEKDEHGFCCGDCGFLARAIL